MQIVIKGKNITDSNLIAFHLLELLITELPGAHAYFTQADLKKANFSESTVAIFSGSYDVKKDSGLFAPLSTDFSNPKISNDESATLNNPGGPENAYGSNTEK